MGKVATTPDPVARLLARDGMTIDDLYKDITKVNRLKRRLKYTLAYDREARQADQEAKLAYAQNTLPAVMTDAEVLGIE